MSDIYNDDVSKEQNIYKKKRKKHYCSNCGKYGHIFKKCKEPITSIGIICVKFESDNESSIIDYFQNTIIENTKNINILNINNKNYNNFKFINSFKSKLKFLFIRRKHTLSYIEFIRGRYDIAEVAHLISLFELMTPYEIEKIKKYDFKELWCRLWKKTSCCKIYEKEYELSKRKFKKLKSLPSTSNYINLDFLTSHITPKFETPEWGFPKGRRNYHEKNMDCAMREFYEETSYSDKDYYLVDNITPINEIFNGTNGVLYKHVYYLAIDHSGKDAYIKKDNLHQVDEIGDISWLTYDEAVKKIRPYHSEKKKLLNEIYLFLVNIVLNTKKEKKTNNILDIKI
jgi:8-oxo-dGTP pyrophosphatase MutT (NUDIX family)